MLCIIPAKKHSRRLPGKNTKELGGTAMVNWTMEAAYESKLFKKVIVTSDDHEVLRLAGGWKFTDELRPQHLIDVPIADVCEHIIKRENLREQRFFCLLLPTNPLRTALDIKTGWAIMRSVRPRPDFVVSISPHRSNAHFALRRMELEAKVGAEVVSSPTMAPLVTGFNLDGDATATQPTYYMDGAVYWANTAAFMQHKTVGSQCPNTVFFQVPEARAVNVDTTMDFFMAEKLIELRKVGII